MNELLKAMPGVGFDITTPIAGCMFPPGLSTWDRYGDTVTNAQRAQMINWIAAQWPAYPQNTRYIQCLLTAYADDCPYKINLFEGKERWKRKYDYGCDLNLDKIKVVRGDAQIIHGVNALWIPHLLCDDRSIYNLPWNIHERAIHLLTGQLNPYCRIWAIGLESTEYLDLGAHNEFCRLFKKYAPDHILASHIQWDLHSRLPDILVVLYEFPWEPGKGDQHSVDEVRTIGAEALAKAKEQRKLLVFTELNINVKGEISRAQNRALAGLIGCIGIAGPI